MGRIRRYHTLIFSLLTLVTACFMGCGKNDSVKTDELLPKDNEKEVSTEVKSEETNVDISESDVNYLEIALNVYYNDAEHNYFTNEHGKSIFVTKEGQYSLTFDCATDLSEEAKVSGVTSLKNMTAIYILDMGVSRKEQSPLTSCNIMYDSVLVDGVELKITQTEPKSAFKSSGIFDTNDPLNAWEGSSVEEVTPLTEDHVVNFTTVDSPKSITVTFTLSDMEWGKQESTTEDDIIGSGYTNTAVFSTLDLSSFDALTLTKYLGNGINLGNTMEAYGRGNFGIGAQTRSYETYWGQPITSAEMLQGMKDCGFDTVRIPVAWTNMMDYENGDYTINTAYLDRVEEIVNYALDAEMFVIINDHWDGGWWAKFGSSNSDTVKSAWEHYESMWLQIAERFQDYSSMLIFESANEELGSGLNAKDDWSDSGSLSESECFELTNAINQKFVDVVRSTAGNNKERFLLVAGYNTDFDKTTDQRFMMPKDTATGKLLISVHYYSPWTYCGSTKQATWGTKSEYEYMNTQFEKMTKFTEQGYGVIIGEFAALPVNGDTGELKTNTVAYTTNLLDNCDLYNYCPMLWSCNDFFKKTTLTMVNDEIRDLFINRCYAEELLIGTSYLDTIKSNMKNALQNAPEMWTGVVTYEPGTPVAWIMWNGGAGTYSVGNAFNPADNTDGITAGVALVEGAGEYTVSLDFRDVNDGLTFAALAIADGERLYPGNIINITEILMDGEPMKMMGDPYTTSDDGLCTRVNLYNSWVSRIPEDARNMSGDLSNASAVILDSTKLTGIHSIKVTFTLITN